MYSEMTTQELLSRTILLLKRAEGILIALQAKCEQRESEFAAKAA
jgi:hypothetical protein